MNKFNIEMQFGVDKKPVVKRTFNMAPTKNLMMTDIALRQLVWARRNF